MMNAEIMGMGSLNFNGDWVNKRTNKQIKVINNIIDGDNMMLVTTAGTMSLDEFSRDYMQVSNEVYNETGNIVQDNGIQNQSIVSGVEKTPTLNTRAVEPQNNDFEIDDSVFTVTSVKDVKETNKASENNLLDKLFNKIESKPVFDINMNWEDFPADQVNMLINFFDVKEDDILEYITNNYIDNNSIKDAIKLSLEKYLNK